MTLWSALLLWATGIGFLTTSGTETLQTRNSGLVTLPGFQVERLLTATAEMGSWISMAFDSQGRVTVSGTDQNLWRITPSAPGESIENIGVEKLDLGIGAAHGLLYAYDSLFAVVGGEHPKPGLYRIQDQDENGIWGEAQCILEIPGSGEHGPHAVVHVPGQPWLYLIAGNATHLPEGLTGVRPRRPSYIHQAFPEHDQGWVIRVSPDGKSRELYCVGLRNAYDIAVSPEKELFTFDSDNEGYMGLPWYRPTTVFHLVSGADFGWRQGPKTSRPWYPDRAGPVVEVGPGSPTGMVFGTHTQFPGKYRQALFVNDWSYGRIYAIHLEEKGASFQAHHEFFLSGRPLPATDLQVGPDGALYFITGGRGLASALFRVTWTGPLSPDSSETLSIQKTPKHTSASLRPLRHQLEALHQQTAPPAIELIWKHLNHPDRSIRYAARLALEHQPLTVWKKRALKETCSQALLSAMIALARQGGTQHRSEILSRLSTLKWNRLPLSQQLDLVRTYACVLDIPGALTEAERSMIVKQLDPHYPSTQDLLNQELIQILVLLDSDQIISRTLDCLQYTATASQQIHYLYYLGKSANLKWTDALKQRLRQYLDIDELRAIASRPYPQVQDLIKDLIQEIPSTPNAPTPIVKQWTLHDLLPKLQISSIDSRDPRSGKSIFRKALCQNCHRLGDSGGVLGPNLTGVSGRLEIRDLLDSLITPNRVIAEPYRSSVVIRKNGTQLTGQIVNLQGTSITVQTDPLRPFTRVDIPFSDIETTLSSPVSLMPEGLLDSLTLEEILDLFAYLLQRPPQPQAIR